MLPSAQNYLKMGGMSAGAAAYTTIGCFLGGVIAIQVVSRFLHRCIPSHVVDCEHSHKDEELQHGGERREEISHTHDHMLKKQQGNSSEATPLLYRVDTALSETTLSHPRGRVSTIFQDGRVSCDWEGPCYGYSDPCAQECYKGVCRRFTRPPVGGTASKSFNHPNMPCSFTAPFPGTSQRSAKNSDEWSILHQPESTVQSNGSTQIRQGVSGDARAQRIPQPKLKSNVSVQQNDEDDYISMLSADEDSSKSAGPHHHHIAKNAFMAIGLQTSIAIALHKLPEGFITFATNHANPKLGFLVFTALFIHNITEGYAMALPLYLALESRWKAMFWSSLLGGISQPLGAAIAALWFKIAGQTGMTPGETVYGCMFAITAGVMTSVALQLFSQSIDLAHNHGNLCITFAFIGMGILGISFALTAG